MSFLTAELKTRIVTAVVLAVIIIGTLTTGSTLLWAGVATAFLLAAVWECLRLVSGLSFTEKAFTWALVLLALGFLAFAMFDNGAGEAPTFVAPMLTGLVALASAFWLFVVPLQIRKLAIDIRSGYGRLTIPLLLASAWLSVVALQRSATSLLLAVVMITVVADVSAYFVGRAFGRVKLAPSISPNKTREGALGGVCAAALWTAVMAFYLGLVNDASGVVLAALAGAFLGVFAVLGDLWESLLKRQSGVKDSSKLLPGHGGVLDRIDAQLAVLPLATLLLTTVKPLW